MRECVLEESRPKILADWLEKLDKLDINVIKLGLEGVQALVDDLNLRPKCQPVISVAGTNGKGSTVKALQVLAKLMNKTIGSFTSPHLFSFNERICFNGTPISDELLNEAFSAINEHPKSSQLTYFEWSFLCALFAFKKFQPELIVLEVGLGGRLDATNVIDADLAIITSIGLDHMDFLGETLEEIGFEKAGVFRANKMVVCQEPSPPESMLSHARALKTDFIQQGIDYSYTESNSSWYYQFEKKQYNFTSLPAIKLSNLVAAMTAWQKLGLELDFHKVEAGMAGFKLSFRQEWFLNGQLLIDVAHNEQSMSHLAKELSKITGKVNVIFSMLKNKAMDECIRLLDKQVNQWFLVELPPPRGRSLKDMAGVFKKSEIPASKVHYCGSVARAYQQASSQTPENDVMVACGSFLLVTELLKQVPSLVLENCSG